MNGVDWEGTSEVGWDTSSTGIIYGGEGLTEADSVIDELYVDTKGREFCGPFEIDVDWHNDSGVFDTWIVGEYGDGWAMIGSCSWWLPLPYVVVSNEVEHQVWDGGGPTDLGDTDAWIVTDF